MVDKELTFTKHGLAMTFRSWGEDDASLQERRSLKLAVRRTRRRTGSILQLLSARSGHLSPAHPRHLRHGKRVCRPSFTH